jgi:hypothetical protein
MVSYIIDYMVISNVFLSVKKKSVELKNMKTIAQLPIGIKTKENECHTKYQTMEAFFLDIANIPATELKFSDVKEIGMELDWFSHIFGRTILCGNLTYESYKNYRCKKEFEKNVMVNTTKKPTVIIIHDWACKHGADVAEKFGSLENIFNNKFDDISKIENKLIFRIKPPKLKKNGKPEKHFNINRKKRFRIHVLDGITSDKRVICSTVISCTFRDLQ